MIHKCPKMNTYTQNSLYLHPQRTRNNLNLCGNLTHRFAIGKNPQGIIGLNLQSSRLHNTHSRMTNMCAGIRAQKHPQNRPARNICHNAHIQHSIINNGIRCNFNPTPIKRRVCRCRQQNTPFKNAKISLADAQKEIDIQIVFAKLSARMTPFPPPPKSV